jgi:hypothetical protein
LLSDEPDRRGENLASTGSRNSNSNLHLLNLRGVQAAATVLQQWDEVQRLLDWQDAWKSG